MTETSRQESRRTEEKSRGDHECMRRGGLDLKGDGTQTAKRRKRQLRSRERGKGKSTSASTQQLGRLPSPKTGKS